MTKCKLCSNICKVTGKSCHDNTIHTHVHTYSQHNILAINIKSKKELVLQLRVCFKNDVTYIFLLHECLYLIKVKGSGVAI